MPKKSAPPRSVEPDWYLVEWMKSKKMKQAELGRRTGWSKATVHDIYHGKTNYYREIVNVAAKALELHPWELFMPPEEANRIKHWRSMFDQEAQLRAAEERQDWNGPPIDDDSGRLSPPRRASQ